MNTCLKAKQVVSKEYAKQGVITGAAFHKKGDDQKVIPGRLIKNP